VETTGENGFTEHEVLRLAAHAGANSTHPVSTSIREAFQGEPGRGEIDASAIAGSRELAGMGVAAEIEGERVVAGNDRLLHHENVAHDVVLLTELWSTWRRTEFLQAESISPMR